jgi:tetratricopeptide (TPR) repeat protein
MRRLTATVLLIALLMSATLAGCSRQAPAPPPPPPREVPVVIDKPDKPDHTVPDKPRTDPGKPVTEVADPVAPELTTDQKYDAALLDALNLLADHKYGDALAAFETARAVKDTDTVQREIDRLKGLLAARTAAEKTIQDIETILADGNADEAGRLAASALLQYGDTEFAPHLARLKREADTLVAAQAKTEAERRDRFRKEGEAALKDNNLRAAALAFERALDFGEDAAVRKQLDGIRSTLTRYDDARKKAAELREDPTNLEDAIASLEDAARAWDTLQVRQELQEYNLALQARRDRVAVADFEVRGDVGVEFFGRTVAEELLPQFKKKYDLVERGQIRKVLDELKLEASDLADNDDDRREVGRLAKVRYLVVGSISRLSGLHVNARLVDMSTGLVVQTARVAARDPGEVVKRLPRLAAVLLMTDDEKAAYERKLEDAEPQFKQVRVADKLPPLPEGPGADRTVPPLLVVWSDRPPFPLGAVSFEDFDKLPPTPKPGQLPAPVVVTAEKEEKIKQRLLYLAVDLGDNLFQRGNYRQASRYYDLALDLYPELEALTVRRDRCQPFLPPASGSSGPRHPRLAVLDFNDRSWWMADHIAPYFSPTYDVVERGEVFWYMNRLGLTAADVLKDASARRWLARALNVRGFVFVGGRIGGVTEGTAHLVDADYGYEVGRGRVNGRDRAELKLRLGELARLVLMEPAERERSLKEAREYRDLLAEGERQFNTKNYDKAVDAYKKALKLRPGSVEALTLLQKTREKADRVAREEAERKERERQQEALAAWQRRQFLLARAAEEARILANFEAAKQGDADRKAQEARKQKAYDQLMIQAREALKNKKYPQAITLFETAVGLKSDPAGVKELTQAKAQAEAAAETERLAREKAERDRREAALKLVRDQLEQERQRREKEEQARAARDRDAIKALVEQAKKLAADKKYAEAITALQNAQQIRKTDEVEKLLAETQTARAIGEQQDADKRAALEKRLAEEKARREAAALEARRKREQYDQALADARAAVKDKRYEQAVAKFQDALKVARTDVVLNEMQQAQANADKVKADADEAKRKQDLAKQRVTDLEQYLKDGKAALDAKPPQWDKAVQAFAEAKKLDPKNIDALFGFDLAVSGRDKETVRLKQEAQHKQEEAKFKKLLADGKANLDARQYDAAVEALTEALRLHPKDADAEKALADAKKGQAGQDADAKKKAAAYLKLMDDGKVALAAGKYADAVKSFEEAQKLFPKDPSSADLLKEATAARDKDKTDLAQKAKEAEEARWKADKVAKALERGRAALKSGDLKAASEAIKEAAAVSPKSGAVLQAQKELAKAEEAQAAFQARLDAARKALKDNKPEDALKEAQAALLLRSLDGQAQDLLRQAQAAVKSKEDALRVQELLTSARKAIGAGQLEAAGKDLAEAKKLAPMDQAVAAAERELAAARRAPFEKLVAQGKAALKDKKWDDAIKAFTEALKISNEKEAADLLKQAQDGQKALAEYTRQVNLAKMAMNAGKWDEASAAYKAALAAMPNDSDATRGLQTATENKKKADSAGKRAAFDKLVAQGKAALGARKYDDAVKALTEALKLIGDDKEAQGLLKQSQDGQKAVAEYNKQIALGKAALNAKKWDDAITAFNAALTIVPNDPEATKGLQAANDGKKPKGDPKEYGKQMAAAAAAEKKQEYLDALQAYQKALKAMPDDAAARAGFKKASDYNQRMVDGKKALDAKKWPDAVKAYEDALKLYPDSNEAKKYLQKAKDKKP